MKLLNLDEVKNITSIGAGPIGGGWTAFFLSKGFRVTSYLHDPSEKEMFMKIVKTAWESLEQLGLSKNASLKLKFCADNKNGKLPKVATITQAKDENKNVCLKFNLNSFSKLAKINKIPIKIVTKDAEIKL